jgi:hypothetical protein
MDAGGIQNWFHGSSGFSRALPFLLPVVLGMVAALLIYAGRRCMQQLRARRRIKFSVERTRRRAVRLARQH